MCTREGRATIHAFLSIHHHPRPRPTRIRTCLFFFALFRLENPETTHTCRPSRTFRWTPRIQRTRPPSGLCIVRCSNHWLDMMLTLYVVEVRVAHNATSRFDTIRNTVHAYLTSSLSDIYLPSVIQGWEDVPLLASSIEKISAAECPCPTASLPIEQTALQIHVYQPTDTDAFEELTSGSGRGEDEQIMAASVCELPSMSWEGLWESLIYSDDIKARLLDYIYATVVFSDADVDCAYTCFVHRNSGSCWCQLTSYRGTVLSCSMVLQAQARRLFVEPLRKSFLSVSLIG